MLLPLPLGVIELKNPADEKAMIGSALNQLQTHQSQVGRQEELKTDRRRSHGHASRPRRSLSGLMRIHRIAVGPFCGVPSCFQPTEKSVDLVSFVEHLTLRSDPLIEACQATFRARADQPWPPLLPVPPSIWGRPFGRWRAELELQPTTTRAARDAIEVFPAPVLQGRRSLTWDPERAAWSWVSPALSTVVFRRRPAAPAPIAYKSATR